MENEIIQEIRQARERLEETEKSLAEEDKAIEKAETLAERRRARRLAIEQLGITLARFFPDHSSQDPGAGDKRAEIARWIVDQKKVGAASPILDQLAGNLIDQARTRVQGRGYSDLDRLYMLIKAGSVQ